MVDSEQAIRINKLTLFKEGETSPCLRFALQEESPSLVESMSTLKECTARLVS